MPSRDGQKPQTGLTVPGEPEGRHPSPGIAARPHALLLAVRPFAWPGCSYESRNSREPKSARWGPLTRPSVQNLEFARDEPTTARAACQYGDAAAVEVDPVPWLVRINDPGQTRTGSPDCPRNDPWSSGRAHGPRMARWMRTRSGLLNPARPPGSSIVARLFSCPVLCRVGPIDKREILTKVARECTTPRYFLAMPTKRFLGLNGTQLQIAIGVLAGMDFLLFGYDQGVTGGLLTLDSFRKYFPTIDTTDAHTQGWSSAEKSNQSTRQGITVAAYNLGCFAGSIPTIWIGNMLEDEAVRRASVLTNPTKHAQKHREHAEKDSDGNTATSDEK
ncbi:hypothetical protein N7532_007296 [Penicillium argentinense]|uniref:Uncharacterized protein n=1 Tax=Penicillium argentinense TaxID=1131581 RepID=A0A9W9F7N3_9EURO|nr:uncharacterized protein N7532_007296 [Penicillium argentinense]KAJ5095005.1 hypothetical protein N7532_007296 [Penicillium argentinense]